MPRRCWFLCWLQTVHHLDSGDLKDLRLGWKLWPLIPILLNKTACCLQNGQSISLPSELYARRESQSFPFHLGHALIECEENWHFGQRLWALPVKSEHAKCSIGPVSQLGHWWAPLLRDKYIARISLACVALVSIIWFTQIRQSFWRQQATSTKFDNSTVSAHMEQVSVNLGFDTSLAESNLSNVLCRPSTEDFEKSEKVPFDSAATPK